MNIHPVKHAPGDKNQYCGPSAISILTGMSTGEAARLLRRITGKASIKGTGTRSVLGVLSQCGLGYRKHLVPVETKIVKRKGSFIRRGGDYQVTKGGLTLAGWLKQTVSIRTAGRVFLVVAGNHWQVITGRRYCCGQTGSIVSINDDKVKRRARVTEVYEILLHAGNKITIPAMARRKPAAQRVDPHKRALEEMLKKHGIPKGKVVPDGHIKDYVIPPCAKFPEGCSTIHYDWGETFYRIDLAIDDPSQLEDGHLSM